ncbi:MAG: glycosyl hydrolase, partial [Bacteroidetes bacterium]|nr:glycosyl hydrolase [Bacteroidota bacterium]
STDGGETWKKVLEISEHTGVNEVHIDPRNPDIMYATSWQRRRHVWTFISGGPETAIYKSTDGGETWNKSQSGIPGGDVGRIGMAVSPVNPNILYAIVDAGDRGGFFKSTDMGASWKKQNSYSTSGNYYQEIFCDPKNPDKVFFMDTYAHVTYDGGKTINVLGEKSKHVDNHALWVDPSDTDHYLMGCDGGIYETWDNASNWDFKANLPVTQFYKVAVDNAEPFYHVYGGTQDNFSMGGPSRTINSHGISNDDWYITNGGDGFESQVDPEDPNIVYAQAQYGYLVRHDKKSGESISIKPIEGKGEPGLRWNWDAPLLISPHKGTRLYFAANKLFKSEDRGNTWTAISGDLSRQIDRNKLPVMGKVWSMDAIEKNKSTSIYGNIVALDESPRKEGLIYVGTDDGLVQITDNTGGNWRKIETFPGIPEKTYVNMLIASQHDDNTVFAAFNNHKNGDFKPYLLKSTDQGRSWTSIASDLPERGSVYAIAEDHIDPNLLFVGTEFGLYFTHNGGQNWHELKSGLPTIAIRDIAIQKRENDLVLASFGRGFYILDDYSPLRNLKEEMFAQEAFIFPTKDALMFVEANPLGNSGKSFQGESFYGAQNPEIGATFTYYIKEGIQTLEQKRKEAEKEAAKAGKDITYPTFEEMRAEDDEEKPYLLFTITDEDGNIINRVTTNASKGVKRMTWDLRYPSSSPIRLRGNSPFGGRGGSGHLVLPGKYFVSLSQSVNGKISELVGPQPFTVKSLNNTTLPAEDREALVAFQNKLSDLSRAVRGAASLRGDLAEKVNYIRAAIQQSPSVPITMMDQAKALDDKLTDINRQLNGDRSVSNREFETPPSITSRIGRATYGLYGTTSAPTQTMKDAYDIVSEEFAPILEELKGIVKEIQDMEKKLEEYGAPYTPGRIPVWQKE